LAHETRETHERRREGIAVETGPWKSARGLAQSRTLARRLASFHREASWTAPVLWRFRLRTQGAITVVWKALVETLDVIRTDNSFVYFVCFVGKFLKGEDFSKKFLRPLRGRVFSRPVLRNVSSRRAWDEAAGRRGKKPVDSRSVAEQNSARF